MPTVIPVKFAYAARDLWFDPGQTDAQEGDHVICATERGTEIGLVTMDAVEMDDGRLRATIGDATLKPVLRIASEADLGNAERLAAMGERAFPVFRRLVAESGLDMKPVGVEYLFGGEKVVCYFSAEERVDFRQLVRDLSRELHERIDMRQIGVREEAAIIGGFARCGQELCCARFGRQFEPVSIRMAKEQDLPLNSTKISGACGRLMCCLRYEFEAYRDFKGRVPKRNAVIETPLGKAKIVEYNTPKEQVCLRFENGKQIRVALADMEASEAAHRKSEELGCACRPDTVTRAALDKLESPEIKMALAELDRKAGVTPVEGFDKSDIFVETRPRRRRRSRGQAHGSQSAQPAPGARDPQRQRDAAGSSEAGGADVGKRRRRRKTQVTSAGEPQQQQGRMPDQGSPQNQAPSVRRRRRHHAPEEGQDVRQSREQGDAASPARPRGMQPKRKRRPGDRGETGVPQEGRQQKAPTRRDTPPKGESAQPKDAAQQAGEAKPKRRRRHRGGRGRGKGGAGTEALGE
ncbi:MAG: regulatory iron-sulfur-containing complex subunit RicT [Acidobacteriota bacterium]|nr:regulatory iron-sulfur-containing complex subunit RicT [Acidobacteriota bacterium]